MSEVHDFLKHHGVRGQKWGSHRSKTVTPRAKGYSDNQYRRDKYLHGERAAKRINKHVLSGKTVKEARQLHHKHQVRVAKLLAGAGAAAYIAGSHAPAIAEFGIRGMNSAVLAKQASNAQKFAAGQAATRLSDTHGIYSHPTIHASYNPETGVWG